MTAKLHSLSWLQIITIVATILIIVAVVLWARPVDNEPAKAPPEPSVSEQQSESDPAPIESSSDLEEVESTLDNLDLEELDTSELDNLEQELL